MADLPAFCFYKEFDPEPAKEIVFDRHYLLYAAKGSMRFETDAKSWVLPPSQAAWIVANRPVIIDMPRPITCCSVLFATDFISAPTDSCTIFEVTPLAREMILACRKWGPELTQLAPDDMQFFSTLANVCNDLAKTPSITWIPSGRSKTTKQAIEFTRKHLNQDISFDDIAKASGASTRTLARRFADETNFTWRQLQRRMRMISAIELLSDETNSITTVALNVGYKSVSAFNAAFKEFTHKSPSEYRKFTH